MTVITVGEEEDALDKDSAGSVWADQAPASHWPTQGGEGGGGCLCELYLILCFLLGGATLYSVYHLH